jgi:hypothetical protein
VSFQKFMKNGVVSEIMHVNKTITNESGYNSYPRLRCVGQPHAEDCDTPEAYAVSSIIRATAEVKENLCGLACGQN